MPDFISDYLQFNSGNEAHPNYHLWSAFSLLASAASRRIFVNQGYFVIKPNLYVGLIGPSGNRKTTAKDEAYDLLYVTLKDMIPFSGECMSKEAITKFMGHQDQKRAYADPITGEKMEYTPFTIFSTELSNFLAINPIMMCDFLVGIYDREFYDVKTKNKGEDTIIRPCVNLLACDTPDNITFRVKTRIMTSGFARRFIPIYETTNSKPIAIPKISDEFKECYKRCEEHLKHVWTKTGQMKWTSDGESFFTKWYGDNFKVRDVNPLMQAYFSCKADLVLKLCIILSIAEYDIKLELTRELILRALFYLANMEPNMRKLYESFGENKLVAPGSRCVMIVIANGGAMSKSQLKTCMWSDLQGRDFDEVLNHYIDSGELLNVTLAAKSKDGKTIKDPQNKTISVPGVATLEWYEKKMLNQEQKQT